MIMKTLLTTIFLTLMTISTSISATERTVYGVYYNGQVWYVHAHYDNYSDCNDWKELFYKEHNDNKFPAKCEPLNGGVCSTTACYGGGS